MNSQEKKIPLAFIWRRLQSLTGVWLVAFLILHLFTNSQAALPLGNDGEGFIEAVNHIHTLPYLHVIEIVLLAIPFAIHIIWGIEIIRTGAPNSFATDGSTPSLTEYPRNKAYTWQRITAWILLLLVTLHVIQMRFLEMPVSGEIGGEKYFITRLEEDPGLKSLAARLKVTLYSLGEIEKEERKLVVKPLDKSESVSVVLLKEQEARELAQWQQALKEKPLHEGQVLAVANNFATAELLMVRETFKEPAMLVFYTILVLTASFHAFNGLWTAMIKWGITLSAATQRKMGWITLALMALVSFLGLAAVWGTYWINLKW